MNINNFNMSNSYDILNHYNDLPYSIKKNITPENIVSDFFNKTNKKINCTKMTQLQLNLSPRFINIVELKNTVINTQFEKLYSKILNIKVETSCSGLEDIKFKLKNILHKNIETFDDIITIFKELTSICKYTDIINRELISFLLFDLLVYKLETFSLVTELTTDSEIQSKNNSYYITLLRLIKYIYEKNRLNCSLKNINDISIMIYLFINELHLDMSEYDLLFYIFFDKPLNDIIHKKVLSLKNEHIDLLDVINSISTYDMIDINNETIKSSLSETNDSELISNEKLGNYLIFGDNLLYNDKVHMDIYELIHTALSVSEKNISKDLNNIRFELTEEEKIFLKQSEDILLAEIKSKNGVNRTVIRYKYRDDLYVVFMTNTSKNVYGKSLLDLHNNKFIIIKNDEVDKYKLIYGKEC